MFKDNKVAIAIILILYVLCGTAEYASIQDVAKAEARK